MSEHGKPALVDDAGDCIVCGEEVEEGAEVEVVALDEPSMEDYPLVDTLVEADAFGAPPVKVVPVRDGVRDTEDRSTRRR
jgi:hypothetical protein